MLFEETAGSQLREPTFIIGCPIKVLPLTRGSGTLLGITGRFGLFTTGREIADGFSGPGDPRNQIERFREQVG